MDELLKKIDPKTVITVIALLTSGLILADKYISKHLITDGTKLKNIVLQAQNGKMTGIFNKNAAKHRIIFSITPDCVTCKFQISMISLAKYILDPKEWYIMPILFDYSKAQRDSTWIKNNIGDFDVYYGNKNIKRILKIKYHPTIYFVGADGYVNSRSATPVSVFGILWKAMNTDYTDENKKPYLHTF